MLNVRRNDPCPCGSGKKYKKCCMEKDDPRFIKMENYKKCYTFKVNLIRGNVTERFAQNNPEVSRTIQILGSQTLEELHDIIFRAFDRGEDHMYEFQFGEVFDAPENERYVLTETLSHTIFRRKYAGIVTETRIGALNPIVGQSFYYWFDFGDDWIHQIDVISIDDEISQDIYPKITARVGDSPPQYFEFDDEEE